jgi:hypothetical protein
MRNATFWYVTAFDYYNNQSFERTYRLHHQGDRNPRAMNNVTATTNLSKLLQMLFTANVVPSAPILATLMM